MTAVTAESATDETPSPGPDRRRRLIGWGVIAAVLVIVGLIGAAISTSNEWTQRGVLDPASAGPQGTRALSNILGEQGIDVIVVRSRTAALDALQSGPATLVLPDTPALSDAGLTEMTDAAADIVLIDPRSRTLRLLLDGSSAGGFAADSPLEPDCDLAEATRSGAVAPGALFVPGTGVTGCYPSDDGFGLLFTESAGQRVSAVDARVLFTNEMLTDGGNAALGLNLLGHQDRVIWYVPDAGDTDLIDADPTLGEQTPEWVSPVIVLLLIAGVAAGIWRGRRFGPLVTERLPVTVRATETTEGRARLYAHARDALHAADELRFAALERLARTLALGSAASASAIADAAAERTGFDRAAVRSILITDEPDSDAQLVALHERLRTLESAVKSAVREDGTPR